MWDYGTGDLGNASVHQIDIGHLTTGLKASDVVSCSGAKSGSRGDLQETPATMIVTGEHERCAVCF